MQELGRRYVAFFNFSMERTGTLWEGRFKSCLVDSDRYLLHCYRYIELNPVRAGIVDNPAQFKWSSYHANGCGRVDPIVTPHERYQALAASTDGRTAAYRAIVAEGIEPRELDEIRAMTSRQRAFGGNEFRECLESEHQRPMGIKRRGPGEGEVKPGV